MRRAGVAGLLALAAAGCAPAYPTQPTAAPRPEPVAPPRAASPAPSPIPPAPGPPAASPPARPLMAGRDACGAEALQGLVGRPRSQIPVPVDPSRQRVACTTCPAAQDVDPGRITFLFDARNGLIQQIRCG